jgi:hypothetical protein
MTKSLLYIPWTPPLPGVIAPYNPNTVSSANALATAGTIYACRVVIPHSGVLHDLAAYHATASGNHRLAIYDTGDAVNGSRSLLYETGSVALAGSNVWQVPKEEAIIPVKKGQALDFVMMADNTTATFGRVTTAASPQGKLPPGYLPVKGEAEPKLAWSYAVGAYAAFPATITEANCGTASGVVWPCIIARVA